MRLIDFIPLAVSYAICWGAELDKDITVAVQQYHSKNLSCGSSTTLVRRWEFNGLILFSGNLFFGQNIVNFNLSYDDYALNIRNITFQHEGQYVCLHGEYPIATYNVEVYGEF